MSYIYMEHVFLMFLDHTRRRSAVGRTPLDEWSARRRDLYLTTHDTHNRQISMPPVGFEPTISAGERPQESYRLCCVVVCDLETSRVGAPYIYNVRLLRVKHTLFLLLCNRQGSETINCWTFLKKLTIICIKIHYIFTTLNLRSSCWMTFSFANEPFDNIIHLILKLWRHCPSVSFCNFQRREYELSPLIHIKAGRRESLTEALVCHIKIHHSYCQHIFWHILVYLKNQKVRRLTVTAPVILISWSPQLLT